MAVTAATKLSDFSGFIDRERSGYVFEKAAQASVVMQLARPTDLPYNGKSFTVVTSKPTVAWVSEGGLKPASSGSIGLKTMDPKKMAAIIVVSSEVVRANPGGYMNGLRDQLAEAFALAFDQAALYDFGPSGQGDAGGGPFATYINQTSSAQEIGSGTDIHADMVAALSTLTAAGKELNGFAFDSRVEPLLLDARDGNERPLYVDLTNQNSAVVRPGENGLRRGTLLNGRAVAMGKGVYSGSTSKIVGFGGDWTQAMWGTVGGISYEVSNQTAVTINGSLVSLWENNLVAIRAEAEYGFLVNDTAAFVRFTDAS